MTQSEAKIKQEMYSITEDYPPNKSTTTNQPQTMTKHDSNKSSRPELIEPSFILGIGEILAHGALKYAPNNWKLMTEDDLDRFRGALLRHTLESANGEVIDPDSGLSHMLHIATNAMFIEWWERERKTQPDKYSNGANQCNSKPSI